MVWVWLSFPSSLHMSDMNQNMCECAMAHLSSPAAEQCRVVPVDLLQYHQYRQLCLEDHPLSTHEDHLSPLGLEVLFIYKVHTKQLEICHNLENLLTQRSLEFQVNHDAQENRCKDLNGRITILKI